jgi:alginate O-acetyltransferase complex protein AlgI
MINPIDQLPYLSLTFGLLALAALGIYYALPHLWQNHWLLVVSYGFCLAWSWPAAASLFLLTAASFLLARRVRPGLPNRGPLLAVGVGLNVLALVFFRSAGFFVAPAVALLARLGLSTQSAGLQLLVPVGLAFYSLQAIAYLVDVSQGKLAPARRFTDFALYLAYFPKLVAGPIERPKPFLEMLARRRQVDNAALSRSLALIVVGLVRKLLIADTLSAAIPAHMWVVPTSLSALELLAWLVVYAFSLYNDFAGYTSLARGVSGLFGIELTPNFNAPFFARTFSEFWNRWHISLSHWLRDYVFFPLSRTLRRRYPGREHWTSAWIPPVATMALSGLWHGLSWHMLLWGGLHGLYQVGERLLLLRFPGGAPAEWRWPRRTAATLAVFALVTLAWVPFKLEPAAALAFWGGLLNWSSLDLQHRRLFIALAVVAVAIALDWMQRRHDDEVAFLRWPRPAQAALLATTIVLVWIVTAGDPPPPFVYQGF